MGYLFLTGATGLLGSYLVRDLQKNGTQLAVLVRSTKLADAHQRIETLIAHWEAELRRPLPRPVVLEGDISQPGLGLERADVDWLAENCHAMMHNAASLTFQAESSDGEPWRTNIHGTRHVLELCREAGIREFHHVSTAYVCGKRRERILETELDEGQELGNDYEVSKFSSEQMVRGADFIDDLTVYRPGIILGDSKTGYTTTFHGFYVPLKLVAALISRTEGTGADWDQVVASIRYASGRLRQALNLTGDECKNYVPVDWVSACMTHIYGHQEQHGKTYHLTPRERAPVSLTHGVMERAFIDYTEATSTATETTVDWAEFEQVFVKQMQVYQTYWGDDPLFDDTNTRTACPHLPCPDLDEALLDRMCRFAIETNFGWPRPAMAEPKFPIRQHLDRWKAHGLPPVGTTNGKPRDLVGLMINGSGGGQWRLGIENGRVVSIDEGLSRRCTAMFYLNSQTFESLAKRQSTVDEGIRTGRILIEGNGVPLPELAGALGTVAAEIEDAD